MTTLTLYTRPKCVYCHILKENLLEWGFTFTEIDVTIEHPDRDLFYTDGHKTCPQLYSGFLNIKGDLDTVDITKEHIIEMLDNERIIT